MHKLYLDTNFLLIPGQFKVDIFSEIKRILEENVEICILEETISELHKIIETANIKDRYAAKLALQLTKHLKTEPSSFDNVDDRLVALAKQGDYVATQDGALKRRLKEKKVRIITLKQKSHLEFG